MKENNIFIKTFKNLEDVLLKEVLLLGGNNCSIKNRGIVCEGDMEMIYRLNYFSRFALKVYLQIGKFNFLDNSSFYEKVKKINFEQYVNTDNTIAVSAIINESIFKTPLFVAQLTKDAVCDRFMDICKKRPSVDKIDPDVEIYVYVFQNSAEVYLNSSGDSLYKRGYKVENHPAPINEITAAAMIELSEWDCNNDFIDFMCGSGTVLIEATMKALNIPAGFYRKEWGFMNWNNFDNNLWKKVVAEENIRDDVLINFYGSDISKKFINIAKNNIYNANMKDFIYLSATNFINSSPKRTPSTVIINPPYDERLEIENSISFYKSIGDTLKNKYKNCTAFIISSNKNAIKRIGLHPSKKMTLYNGQLECSYYKYDIY